MDGRLLEVAIRGNKQMLVELLEGDPLILGTVMGKWTGKDSPLHLGALYGNVDFVREILHQNRGLTRELNSRGESSLHLASKRGQIEVVKEILSADPDACFVRDTDGMIPLHVAAIKGQVKVMEELVNAKGITAFLLTDGGEPILHLCAKNNQFKALRKLVELVEDDGFVNLKDSENNNILHLLSAKKQTKLIRFLVKERRGLDVNAVNNDGSTPLDISLTHESGLGRLTTDIALITAGANTATPIFARGKTKMLNDNYGNWFMEALLVVAVLIINVAFQASLNPPGGVWQPPEPNNVTLPSAVGLENGNVTIPIVIGQENGNVTIPNAIGQEAGKVTSPNAAHPGQSIMAFVDHGKYQVFCRANNISLISSMLVIAVLLMRCFLHYWFLDFTAILLTSMSVMAMATSYVISLSFTSGDPQWLSSSIFLLPLLSTIMVYMPAFVPVSRMFYFVPIWLVKKIKSQHHLLGVGSCLKTLILQDTANSRQC